MDPKNRHMQVEGVGVCLSCWAWYNGYSPHMVGLVLREEKNDAEVKGDMRLCPGVQHGALRETVEKWLEVAVEELTQGTPEHLDGNRDIEARKFITTVKVRGVLYQMWKVDVAEGVTGTLKFCSLGWFAEIFWMNYGRFTGPACGKFWATDKVSSLMGGYCRHCSSTAAAIACSDPITRKEGFDRRKVHLRWVRRVRKNMSECQGRAEKGLTLGECDDGATTGGTAMPILRKVAQKFVTNRVACKIMILVLFHTNSHPNFTRRAIIDPCVHATANLAAHCILYCSLPAMVADCRARQVPVPDVYERWPDGGPGTWNATLFALMYYLVKKGVFREVFIKRLMRFHSHNIADAMIAKQEKHNRFRPGHGAITPELLKKHLGEIANAGCVEVNQVYDYSKFLLPCLFDELKNHVEAEAFWLQAETGPGGAVTGVTVKCANRASAPKHLWDIVARGAGDECFFKAEPAGEPDLAPFWHTEPATAEKLHKSFVASAKSVATQASSLEKEFLQMHGHGGSPEARGSIRKSYENWGATAPTAGAAFHPSPKNALHWPPPAFHTIDRAREAGEEQATAGGATGGGSADAGAGNGGAASGVAGLAPMVVASRVPEAQAVVAATLCRERTKLKQPVVAVGKVYVVLQPGPEVQLWIAEVTKLRVANAGTAYKGRLLPRMKGGAPYWGHPSHHKSCDLYEKKEDWSEVPGMGYCQDWCKASGPVDLKWLYPAGHTPMPSPEDSVGALQWAESQTTGSPLPQPEWFKGHWKKQAVGHDNRESLGALGPEVEGFTSGRGGEKFRMSAASVKVYRTTAHQVAASQHPWVGVD